MTDDVALSADSPSEAVTPASVTDEVTEVATAAPPTPAKQDDEETTASGESLTRQQRNWRALERDRDHWRQMAERLIPQPQAAPKADPAPESRASPKTLADFEYDEAKYQSHLFKEVETRAIEAAERRLRENQERESTTRRRSEFAARERDFAKSNADYFDVTRAENLNITQAMVDAVSESDEAAAVLYFLAKNPGQTDRIAQLSTASAAREIGRIEERLKRERDEVKAPRISAAPPPPPKLDASEPGVERDPEKMTSDEWLKWRNKQVNRKRN